MPEVNLLKDTEKLNNGEKKPVVPMPPELTTPDPTPPSGLKSFFSSLLHRGPKSLPVSTPNPVRPQTSTMSTGKSRSGERILSEKRQSGPSVIPLPEDDDNSYNVNLLSEDLILNNNPRQRAIMLGVIALGAAVMVGLAYGGLLVYQNKIDSKITLIKSELSAVNDEIVSLTKDQKIAASMVQKISAIRSLIDRHTRWTKFFSLLERYTLPSVTYGPAFNGTLGGSITLAGKTNSYEEVARQYLIFQQLVREKKFISAYQITGATSTSSKEGATTVTFVVSMTLLPEDFTRSESEIVTQPTTIPTIVVTPNATNTNSTNTNQP